MQAAGLRGYNQDISTTEVTEESADITALFGMNISPDEDTSEDKKASISKDTAADDAWKVEFEKSLLENYGVTPDHYENLGNGVYQVYVEIDGKVVPYVAVDSVTGDYHG